MNSASARARLMLIALAATLGCVGAGVIFPVATARVPGQPGTETFCGSAASPDSTVYDTTQVTQRPVLYDANTLKYPGTARARRVQGRVLLAVTVNVDGRPDPQSIETLSSPDAELTDAATHWVRSAMFVPACLSGRSVRVRVAIPVDFKLSK